MRSSHPIGRCAGRPVDVPGLSLDCNESNHIATGDRAIPMILRLFRRTPRNANMTLLYGAIVAQARSPVFYGRYGVPDTVNGRFEMVVLHTILVLRRLKEEPGLRGLGQALFDAFCADMDANLREMGVGD